MVKCAVSTCNNRTRRNQKNLVKYFHLPTEKKLKAKWLRVCGLESKQINLDIARTRICSDHFKDTDYTLRDILLNTPIAFKRLKDKVIPSVNLPEIEDDELEISDQEENKQLIEEALQSYDEIYKKYEPECEIEIDIDQIKSFPEIKVESDVTVKNKKTKTLSLSEKKSSSPILEVQRLSHNIRNIGVQTEGDLSCVQTLEILDLKNELKRTKQKARKLEEELGKLNNIDENILKFFTKTQIKKLKEPNKIFNWCTEDFSKGFSLYRAGPAAYKLLLNTQFPFPSVSSLNLWARKLNLQPGELLDSVLGLINNSCGNIENERLCILYIGEMKLKTMHENNSVLNEINDTNNEYVQAIMARGLFKNWKQIIYYNFNCRITAEILKYKIIKELKQKLFTVVAIVTNTDTTDINLWKELQVTYEKPYFLLDNNFKNIRFC